MSLYKQFKTDTDLERSGVLVQYGLNSKKQPISFRIARAGGANVAYNKRLDILTKPYHRQLQSGNTDPELMEQLVREAFIDKVLLGWEGVEDESGEPMAFNKANAEKLFADLPDLYKDLQELSMKSALFKEVQREEELGN